MSNSNAMGEIGYLLGAELFANSLTSIVGLAGYFMLALGLYTIAKRRGINNPWLAWIPFGQTWMLGCVSDQYQYVVRGQQKSKRKALLWLEILTSVMSVITIISLVNALITSLVGVDWSYASIYGEYVYEDVYYNMTDAQLMQMASSLTGTLVLAFVLMGLAIALAVVKYMALYDLFRSCDPGTATAFTVLSIFLGSVVTGIVALVDRNKDLGMQPPRPAYGQPGYLPPQGWQQPPQQTWQQPPQGWQQPPQQNWQQPQEPWQNNNQQW